MGPIVLWFRRDLRLADNRALAAAVESGRAVLPLFVLDDETPGRWRMGGASRWWLGRSLAALAAALEALGSRLLLRRGVALEVVPALAREVGASAVHATRRYEPWAGAEEHALLDELAAEGRAFRRFGGALLHEPEAVRSKAGEPFRVFTPFWRAASAVGAPPPLRPRPNRIPPPDRWPASDRLESWALSPTAPDWAGGLRASWQPGEAGAAAALDDFLSGAGARYAAERDRPDLAGTSRLSPHLHFGEIGPGACWHALERRLREAPETGSGLAAFRRQLGWREFSYHLLHHWPTLPEAPFRRDLASFPWRDDGEALGAWQKGRTGYPIVDAGMRELWQTGWMHNRVRMIVASFLVKDLLVPWQAGEAWFHDTLVDADLANNAAGWQWVAGTGADAAPYFRVFNPVKQGQTFDPDGSYVRRYVPELARLPTAHLHAPWAAPSAVLAAAGVRLGESYPAPIVDHDAARRRALAAYEATKAGGS
jgi:deoxyribodipyrimidine photo-lyase